MNSGKRAIFAGLAAGLLFAAVLAGCAISKALPEAPQAAESGPVTPPIAPPPPLSAVVVTSCSLAVALFIQLDATHLLRADPRQSDLFTAKEGKMVQTQTGPMPWDDAYKLAQSAVLSSNVVVPCPDNTV